MPFLDERARTSIMLLKIVHQKGLFDTIKENPNFPSCRGILDIYGQWLLNINMKGNRTNR